jgi:hypothetical protein
LKLLDDYLGMAGLEGMGFGRDEVCASLREFADGFFTAYARSHGKQRWADKTPAYANCLRAIDEVFIASPRYVMIYRHGLDVAYSLTKTVLGYIVQQTQQQRSPEDNYDPVQVAAAYWRDQVRKMQRFQEAHLRRCFPVRYEQLVGSPEEVLRDMFAFLGEPFEEQVLRFNEQSHHTGMEDGKVLLTRTFEPSIGNYRRWRGDELQVALKQAEPELSALGYSV